MSLSTCDIQQSFNDMYACFLLYGKISRGREIPLEMIKDSNVELFKLMPSLSTKILTKNPEIVVSFEVDDQSRFKEFFLYIKLH